MATKKKIKELKKEVKSKSAPKVEVREEEEKEIDPELILGDEVLVEDLEDDEETGILDEDEADPFKDRFEE